MRNGMIPDELTGNPLVHNGVLRPGVWDIDATLHPKA